MSDTEIPNRCRLVLISFPSSNVAKSVAALSNALSGGDVASVILARGEYSEKDYQTFCEKAVPVVQAADAAAMVVDNSQVAGRAKADGIHITGSIADVKDVVNAFSPRLIVGASSNASRDDALDKGELRPDYVFFGKLDGDTHPESHPKNIELGEWWASMIELPCIVMGGYLPDSVTAIAKSGAEFVALSAAIFGEGRVPSEQVAAANAFLDEVGDFAEAADAR